MTPASSKTIREETLIDVPTSDLDAVVGEFVAAGAKVNIRPQGNGLWTLIATFETVTP